MQRVGKIGSAGAAAAAVRMAGQVRVSEVGVLTVATRTCVAVNSQVKGELG